MGVMNRLILQTVRNEVKADANEEALWMCITAIFPECKEVQQGCKNLFIVQQNVPSGGFLYMTGGVWWQ